MRGYEGLEVALAECLRHIGHLILQTIHPIRQVTHTGFPALSVAARTARVLVRLLIAVCACLPQPHTKSLLCSAGVSLVCTDTLTHSGRSPVHRAFFRLETFWNQWKTSNTLGYYIPAVLTCLSDALNGSVQVFQCRHDEAWRQGTSL